jgi:hypothetical protein
LTIEVKSSRNSCQHVSPGVVDPSLNQPKRIKSLIDQKLTPLGQRQISRHQNRFAAIFSQGIRCFARSVLIGTKVNHQTLDSSLGQGDRSRPTNTTGRTRHHGGRRLKCI